MNVAVIGVGRWGINHVRALMTLKKERISSVSLEDIIAVDINPENLYRAKSLGVEKAYTSLDSFVSREKVDAAIIAVPTKYHHEVAKKIIPLTSVLIEKPLASNIKEAKDIVRLAKKYDRVVAVGHIERYNPVIMAVKDRLKELGEDIIYISGFRVGPGPVASRSNNLGVAHDLLVHDIDTANMLVGSLPTWVIASKNHLKEFPYEVEINAVYGYENKVVASLRASWRTGPKLKKRIMLIQTESHIITFDYISQYFTVESGLKEHRSSPEYVDLISSYESRSVENISLFSGKKEPLILELIDFLESVEKGREPIANLKNGYLALKCVLASLEAADKGIRVKINWDDDPI